MYFLFFCFVVFISTAFSGIVPCAKIDTKSAFQFPRTYFINKTEAIDFVVTIPSVNCLNNFHTGNIFGIIEFWGEKSFIRITPKILPRIKKGKKAKKGPKTIQIEVGLKFFKKTTVNARPDVELVFAPMTFNLKSKNLKLFRIAIEKKKVTLKNEREAQVQVKNGKWKPQFIDDLMDQFQAIKFYQDFTLADCGLSLIFPGAIQYIYP